jgi:DNA-binding protein YbaB
VSYIRESVKAIVEHLVESSLSNAYDKKAEWTKSAKEVENAELQQSIKNALANTKGKHGRRTIQQEELSIDEILITDDKQALKESIKTALNNMEHDYETAYIKAALIRSRHLDKHISFSIFLRAICAFAGKEYKYDPAQRVDTFIYQEEKNFYTSKNSKWQRGRRIVSYLTEVFEAIPNTSS